MGADDARVLPPGLRRAALHRAAAAEGSRAAAGSGAAAARGRRRPQRGHAQSRGLVRRHALGAVRGGRISHSRARRAGAERPLPDHVHLRHRGRAEGGGPRPALPARPAAPGRALARPGARRPRVVHGRGGLVEVGPQRVHRAVAARRRRAAARRALRSGGAAGVDRARGSRRALHGPDGIPRDREAGRAAPAAVAEGCGRRRRGAQPRGPARLARGDRALDPRRLRPDRDRPADRRTAGRGPAARVDGPPAPGRQARRGRRRARPRSRRPIRRSSSATWARSRTAGRGTPATASPRTTTATCTSRAAPTT